MDNDLLVKVAELFHADGRDLKLLGGFSNNVYECKKDNHSFILKFYLSSMYKKEKLEAELDWISFLMRSGVNVTAPLPSINGNYLEIIHEDNNESYYVLAFEKAEGVLIDTDNPTEWNSKLFYKWGKTMGKLHSLSKIYHPPGNIKKQNWNEGTIFTKDLEGLNETIIQKWEEYVDVLKTYPRNGEFYGMIHNDLHHGNFYLHDNEIVLFDFGDCEYNWFVYDIAIVLYHAIQTINEDDIQLRKDFASDFFSTFMQGYFTENKLDTYWLSKIPFFLNYRQIYSYIYFVHYLSEEQKSEPRVKGILNGMRYRIENDVPYIDSSFSLGNG